jgi:hypothetical protein
MEEEEQVHRVVISRTPPSTRLHLSNDGGIPVSKLIDETISADPTITGNKNAGTKMKLLRLCDCPSVASAVLNYTALAQQGSVLGAASPLLVSAARK